MQLSGQQMRLTQAPAPQGGCGPHPRGQRLRARPADPCFSGKAGVPTPACLLLHPESRQLASALRGSAIKWRCVYFSSFLDPPSENKSKMKKPGMERSLFFKKRGEGSHE